MKKKMNPQYLIEAEPVGYWQPQDMKRKERAKHYSLFRHCSSYISNLNCAVGYLLEMEEKKYSVRNEEKAGFLCCKWLSMIWAKEI